MSQKVLIVDDEAKLRSLLNRILALEGFEIYTSDSISGAVKLLEKQEVNVVLCDVKLPDGNGVEFVKQVKSKYPPVEVILLTAYGNIPDGIQAIKNGAFDYITKGDDNDKIIPLLYRALEKNELQLKVARLEQQVEQCFSFDSILGQAKGILQAKDLARKVAPTEATVLLLGETGTGKEVFAQAIHAASLRSKNSFVAINCSAFSNDLLESEIFGHKAGAFTGATKDKKGLIEEANNGTLFLDEIGEMHQDLQAKLLRVLESSEFIKVGDTRVTKVNVRIIAATNRNLEEEVKNGRFREDLFYRLNVFTITLPALNERKADIKRLAEYFMAMFSRKTNKKISSMSPEFQAKLEAHNWKGNIRELKNVIERAVILTDSDELSVYNLPFEFQMEHVNDASGPLSLASVEKKHIIKVLQHTGGNKAEAARLLDIGVATLYRKLEEYALK
jgi:two-component system NtrC family response regulator